MATGISSVATMSTFIGLPSNIPLGAVSLAGTSISGVITVLTSNYQTKLTKVTKLADIVTSIAVFEMSVSKALNDGDIDEQEFQVPQDLHLKVINEFCSFDRKMEAETRNQVQENLLEEINKIRKILRTIDTS